MSTLTLSPPNDDNNNNTYKMGKMKFIIHKFRQFVFISVNDEMCELSKMELEKYRMILINLRPRHF